MKLHLAGDVDIDPDAFERETLAELGMPAEIVMRHRTPHFSHIFASDGYSAGYYSYLWSDALTADAAEVFEEAGSYYDTAGRQSVCTTTSCRSEIRSIRPKASARSAAETSIPVPCCENAASRWSDVPCPVPSTPLLA